VRIFPDPFRGSPHILVLSEVLDSEKKPSGTNHRASCARVMEKVKAEIPWFGMEQGKYYIQNIIILATVARDSDKTAHDIYFYPKYVTTKPKDLKILISKEPRKIKLIVKKDVASQMVINNKRRRPIYRIAWYPTNINFQNGLCSMLTVTHTDGPSRDTQDPRDLTTALSAQTTSTDEMSSKLTIERVFTPASRFLEPTLKSCLHSGSSRLDPARESRWVISSGWPGKNNVLLLNFLCYFKIPPLPSC